MTVGFDIGGTNARAAVVDADGVIVDSLGTDTPHDAEGLTRTIVEMVGEPVSYTHLTLPTSDLV